MFRKNNRYRQHLISITQLVTISAVYCGSLTADATGVIGGISTENSAGFGGVITDENGSITSVADLPDQAAIQAVDINASGRSILAGYAENDSEGNDGYFAIVSPSGTIISTARITPGDPADRLVLISAAINDSGNALIGGNDSGNNSFYAAQVAPNGTISTLSLTDGDSVPFAIYSVDLNNSGVGLVGGEGNVDVLPAYAALVQADGSFTQISGLNSDTTGRVFEVSINESGQGILGGYVLSGGNKYLGGFVSSNGTFTSFFDELTAGTLNCVSINDNGRGIVGGDNASNQIYAAAVSVDGTLTSLIESPTAGVIRSVSINNSNEAIIGGQAQNEEGNDAMYAALIRADNSLVELSLPSVANSIITSVAINDAGLGLIGGVKSTGYAALVAPNGTVTEIDLGSLNANEIASVALAPSSSSSSNSVLNQATPSSVNASNSSALVQFAAAATLQTRFIEKNKLWVTPNQTNKTASIAFNDDLLVYNDEENDYSKIAPGRVGSKEAPNSIWFEPFANFLYVDREGSIPKYNNSTWGGLIGYDRQGEQYLAGIAGGYAYNDTSFSQNAGSSKVHQGMLTLYGAYYWKHFWIGASAWGGRYYLDSTRTTLSTIQSYGKTHGWLFSPQLEVASPWAIDKKELYHVEPFAAATWVKNWQEGYTETGESGLNLNMPRFSAALWQIEAGLRFYEKFIFGWGDFRLQQKISYMNQNPSGSSTVQTSFVEAASTFPVAIASSRVQNLVSGQLVGIFLPNKTNLPYGGFSSQITANGNYQSYFVSLFIGGRF